MRHLTPIHDDRPLAVVIPVYNERETVLAIAERVAASPLVGEVILVDDGSKDGTRDLLGQLEGKSRFRIILHERNQGKGAALRTGFAAATRPIVVVQDADLEYDPGEYPQIIEPIVSGYADVVYGSRFLGAGRHRVHLFWHYVGNRMLTTMSNMFTNLNLTDMETCYKAFRREVIQAIQIEENRFGVEPELTAKIAKQQVRVYEVPVSYYGRSYEEGKKIGWKDGVSALRCIVKYGLKR